MKTDKRSERRRSSTRELIGIEAILNDGVRTSYGELVFFLVKPTNIAVLSEANIESRVMSLADVIKSFPEIEMLSLNSRENYEGNKRYLLERMKQEKVPEIYDQLEKDLFWLDTVQSQMATAREFALALRLVPERQGATTEKKKGKRKSAKAAASRSKPIPQGEQKRPPKAMLLLARLEKALNNRGFSVQLANSQEIMRLMSVYFTQNVTTERFEYTDGERFAIEQLLHGGNE